MALGGTWQQPPVPMGDHLGGGTGLSEVRLGERIVKVT